MIDKSGVSKFRRQFTTGAPEDIRTPGAKSTDWRCQAFVSTRKSMLEDISVPLGWRKIQQNCCRALGKRGRRVEVLAGKDPNTIAPRPTDGHYRVDARQLQRWQLAEKNLPPDVLTS
jgi:hypothetical protein